MTGSARAAVVFFLALLPACGGAQAVAPPVAAAPAPPVASPPVAAAAPSAPERTGVIRRGERGLTLLGPALTVGAPVPSVPLRGPDLGAVNLDFADGTHRIVMLVPSLDTNTCSMQTRTFNIRATEMAEGVEVIVVSRDLPFAQARYCGANGIDRVRPLSDFEAGAFGQSWGLLTKETALLARAVAVVDGSGTLTYLEVVENLPDEPDYDGAMAALSAATGAPIPE